MNRFFRILGLLIMMIGIIAFFSPNIRIFQHRKMEESQIAEFHKKERNTDDEQKKALRKICEEYNEELIKNKQKDFKDAWSVTQMPFDVSGFEDGCFGSIQIPAMDCTLPLYLGASEENMAKGAVILGQTSLPIGGKNTNSVIAAHRGYHGIPYFREIETLRIGDVVHVKNLWETLDYYVKDIKIIFPDSTEEVLIQKDKDMITLLTCHPYRTHGKFRYVVYCERGDGKKIKSEESKIKTIKNTYFISSKPDIEREKKLRKYGAILIAALFLIKVLFDFGKREKKNKE